MGFFVEYVHNIHHNIVYICKTKPFGAETRILWKNYINITAVDDLLATCVTSSSTDMI